MALFLGFVGNYIFRPILRSLPDAQVPWRLEQTWTFNFNPCLIGQDKLPVGDQVFDLPPRGPAPLLQTFYSPPPFALTTVPPLLGVTIRPIWRSLPDQPVQPLLQTWVQGAPLTLRTIAPGLPLTTFANYDWPNPVAPPRLDQTSAASYNKNLIGKDQLPVGDQVTDLPPAQRAPDQIQLRSWQWFYNVNLIGKDRLPVGDQIFELVPRPYEFHAQLRTWAWPAATIERIETTPFSQLDWPNPIAPFRIDQTWTRNYQLTLVGKDQLPIGDQVFDLAPGQRPPEQIQLHAWTWFYNLNLVGQDKLPIGDISTELPRQPWRAEQTWTYSYNLNLIGQDKLPIGEQLTDLPPRDFARQVQTWTQTVNIPLITAPADLTKQVRQQDWPLPVAPPRLDQSYATSFNKNLIGQDQLPIRQQDWPNPIGPAAVKDWIQGVNLALTTVVIRPFNQYDWPLTPAAAQPERTIAASFNKNLIGQDQLPVRQQDWPNPVAPPLAKDWIQTVNLALQAAPALQLPLLPKDWPNPIAPPRLDQFTGASFSKNLIGQDRLPIRQQDWPLPTPAPMRQAELSTWLDRTKLLLQKPFAQYDWPNPTLPARDPTLATITASYNANLIGQDRLPNRQQDWPNPSASIVQPLLRDWITGLNLALNPPTVLNILLAPKAYPNPAPATQPDRSFGFFNPNYYPPTPPPPALGVPHNLHFHVTVGKLKSF